MNLSEGETRRDVYTLPTLVQVNLGIKTMSLMRRMPETCKRRLITSREAYATSTEGELLPTLTTLLMMRRTKTTDRGQELPLASLSHMIKTTAMNTKTEIHLREA